MILCAGYCIHCLEQSIRKTKNRKMLCGCGIAYVIFLVVSIGINHPQEHSYFNWIAGNNLEDVYELDYWDMSIRQAYDIIDEDLAPGKTVSVSALNLATMWGVEGNWEVLPREQNGNCPLPRSAGDSA
jgi:hypothetical protein